MPQGDYQQRRLLLRMYANPRFVQLLNRTATIDQDNPEPCISAWLRMVSARHIAEVLDMDLDDLLVQFNMNPDGSYKREGRQLWARSMERVFADMS